MGIETGLPFPKEEYAQLLKDFYADINGPGSFDPAKNWQSDKWSAAVECSRGKMLEKAGFSLLHLVGGTINEAPATIKLFETLMYPANPRIPGLIIMTNTNKTDATGTIVVFYTDLIIQDGMDHKEEKELFATTVKNICEKHGHSSEEHKALLPGRGLLGGSSGECGILNFFEEKDIPFLEDLIKEVIPVYRNILKSTTYEDPQDEDFAKMHLSRARIIEWIILEDYGVKVARDNEIPLEVIEAYAFPPVIRY